METNRSAGHLTALLTILIWGTTFTSTKSCWALLPLWRSCSFAFCWASPR